MSQPTTYGVDVTPSFEGLSPRYDMSVYRTIRAGVSGPTGETYIATSLEGVDRALASWGYARTQEYGPICANGFASAPLVRVPVVRPLREGSTVRLRTVNGGDSVCVLAAEYVPGDDAWLLSFRADGRLSTVPFGVCADRITSVEEVPS